MDFRLKNTDRNFMVAELRKMGAITLAPSNISDIYDINLIKNRISTGNGVVKVFLDNNILTRVLNLPVAEKDKSRTISEEEINICILMGYFNYCGINLLPNISMYESESTPDPKSRILADIRFRYFEHLPPQVFLNLARERIYEIPTDEWSKVKYEVDNNSVTQADIQSNPYTGGIHSQKAFYVNLMKAWLIYKEGKKFNDSFSELMDWIFKNSISDQNNHIFLLYFLSRKRLGSIIKNINTTDSARLLRSIANAAWDLAHMNIFLICGNKFYRDAVHAFCSRDKLCHELLSVSIAIDSELELEKFLDKNYSRKQRDLIIEVRDRHNSRKEKDEHGDSVELNIDNTIGALEDEVKRCAENRECVNT